MMSKNKDNCICSTYEVVNFGCPSAKGKLCKTAIKLGLDKKKEPKLDIDSLLEDLPEYINNYSPINIVPHKLSSNTTKDPDPDDWALSTNDDDFFYGTDDDDDDF